MGAAMPGGGQRRAGAARGAEPPPGPRPAPPWLRSPREALPGPARPHPRPRLTSVRRSPLGPDHFLAAATGSPGGEKEEEKKEEGCEEPRGSRGQAAGPAVGAGRGPGREERLTGGRRRRLPRAPAAPSRSPGPGWRRDELGVGWRRRPGRPWARLRLPPALRPSCRAAAPPAAGHSRFPAAPAPPQPRAAHVTRRRLGGGVGGKRERERETPRARDHAGSVTLRYVTSRHGPRCTPGAGMEPRLRNSPSLHVIARLRPALSTAPRAVPGAARRRTSSRHLHVTAGSAPSSRPRRAVTGRPAFLSEQIADPARIPVGRGAEQSSTASPGPRSAPPRAGSDGSRSGSGRCSPAERSAAPSQNNGRKRSHHLGRRIRPRNGSSTWESF